MAEGMPLLSLAIWIPILFGVLAFFLNPRICAFLGGLLGFLVTLPLYFSFAPSAAFQFVENIPWVSALGIHYHLGIDGISLWLVILNALITFIVVIAGWPQKLWPRHYFGAFLIMSGLVNGAFAALDGVLFYVFWEAMLIPMFLIIGIWGGPNRVYATIKFFLYTLFGSLLLLAGLIYLRVMASDFSIIHFQQLQIPFAAQIALFIAFFFAFAVKIPMWPVHTWLPDAHVEAPTGGSVVLAAVLLKLGAYGFLRFALPIAPEASAFFSPLMIALSLIAIIYIGFVAIIQPDMKKLIAYSSIAHMGFVTLGIFLFDQTAIKGAIVQMVSHGFISAGLFLCVGVLYDRMHTRLIADYGGVANVMPAFATLFMFFAMANSGLPGTSGFVGELFVVLGAMGHSFWVAAAAALSLVLAPSFTLWMYKRVVFGNIANDHVAALQDLNFREWFVLLVLVLAVLAMGLYPRPWTEVMTPSVDKLLLQLQR
jgi:NADH-quinone oxidoreductase subunit M